MLCHGMPSLAGVDLHRRPYFKVISPRETMRRTKFSVAAVNLFFFRVSVDELGSPASKSVQMENLVSSSPLYDD